MGSGCVRNRRWEGLGFNSRELRQPVCRAQFAEEVRMEFQLGLRGVRAQREWERRGKGTWSEARTRRGLIQVDIRTDYLLQSLLLKYVSKMSPYLSRDGQIG
jgi:hypothetical protein